MELQKSEIISEKDRKKDHIDLAFKSSTHHSERDTRFFYEPALTTHPLPNHPLSSYFLGHQFSYPIWVSSMTGGTGIAKNINRNLARACKDFGLGMGLGSCRKLLSSNEFFDDFAVRSFIGDQPLYANLGIAQINELIQEKSVHRITELLDRLEADGLIVHINPVQEWMQPEGDPILNITPVDAIIELIEQLNCKIIVKEVGQGMGPASMKALMSLPIDAIEFGAFGGTNFARLEAMREANAGEIDPICYVGHTVSEMIGFIHDISKEEQLKCKEFIISGSIRDYLDGYYYNECLSHNSIYGQAAGFLKHAMGDYDTLAKHVESQVQGYAFAMRYLRVRPPSTKA